MRYSKVFHENFLKQLEKLSPNHDIHDDNLPFVDVEAIARDLGLTLTLGSIEGKAQVIGPLIYINQNLGFFDQRFEIAKQIGLKLQPSLSEQNLVDFAMQFLMPKSVLIQYLTQNAQDLGIVHDDLSDQDIQTLCLVTAKDFLVSKEALAKRIQDLDLIA